ncbi:hypothetical protein HYE67_001927 [Fusarium culmorum]|uniref:Uncharacterized protein n=1 Tax=Fusarium culmorum TaxID=5516 RepID=A0A2T4GWP6_FUSCU|nr:hypothetical protein FCULG_00006111 [Fusarium culmorum]QPC59696.1 hypothetical protein HYE67_001927 [Fusarium culmorum]
MNIPEDSLMPEYGDGIHGLRPFTPTEPETDSGRSLVNHIRVPEHQQPIPQKRTRLSAGLNSDCSTPPEESFGLQGASADEEASRVVSFNLCLHDRVTDLYYQSQETSYRISTKRNIQALDERIVNTKNLMELCSNELIEKQHGAYSARELEDARRRQDEAKQSLQALRDGIEDDRKIYTETLERIEIFKETIQDFKQTITKYAKERRALYAKLAILNIPGCQNLDVVPTETLDVFCSSAIEVLKSVERGCD